MPPTRLPACDPCRASKLACDHSQPVCARCRARNIASDCFYRSLPFKKTKRAAKPRTGGDVVTRRQRPQVAIAHSPVAPVAAFVSRPHRYPNPGYLGPSSYTTLFEKIPSDDQMETSTDANNLVNIIVSEPTASEAQILHGAELIEQLYRLAHLPTCMKLVNDWLATGSNLHLAGSFTSQCSQSVNAIMMGGDRQPGTAFSISTALFKYSCRKFEISQTTNPDRFCAQFTGQSARWETLCLFFIMVCRATMSPRCSECIGDTLEKQQKLRRLAMHFADCFLDISLALDCLNDLQLILQYEIFIIHSLVDGDQSFEAWRRLGDVVSSLFALGYHENIEGARPIPEFLKELRQAAFGCSYSADKNVSVFLGRPPRICREVCRFHSLGLDCNYSYDWLPDTPLDLMADTRWTAICAVLKEDTLRLSMGVSSAERSRKASNLQRTAETQWSSLPGHFRLNGPLKAHECRPTQLDMMLSAKLNYLHVLFLLHLAVAQQVAAPGPDIIAVASDMFSLVIEAVMLKDRLVNTGTSLAWKVAYYGLSAAGVICLALLRQSSNPEYQVMITSRALRDLATLVGEVELGTLVYKEDANYELLDRATRTIRNLLDRLFLGRSSVWPSSQPPSQPLIDHQLQYNEEGWRPWVSNNCQDFEVDFWHTLSEHPLLLPDDMH